MNEVNAFRKSQPQRSRGDSKNPIAANAKGVPMEPTVVLTEGVQLVNYLLPVEPTETLVKGVPVEPTEQSEGVPVEPTEQSEGVQLVNYFLPVEPNPPTRSTSVLPESASKRFINIPCAIRSPLFISCVTSLIFKRNTPIFPSLFSFS